MSVYSSLILDLGDHHSQNIVVDCNTAELLLLTWIRTAADEKVCDNFGFL